MDTKQYHLGVNLGHDRSAAIIENGNIVVAIHQERLDRHKHSIGILHQSLDKPDQTQLPFQAINYCLDAVGIRIEDLASITANMPGHDYSLNILKSQLPQSVHDRCFALPSHHLGHAYTAYYPSGFDDALVISVDATGTTKSDHATESYSIYSGQDNKLTLLHSEKCFGPWAEYGTLGFIYEQITRLAGFVSHVGNNVKVPEAGKLMGLAPYGGAQPNWSEWCRPVEGSYHIEISPYDIALEIEALKLTYQNQGSPNYFSPWVVDLAYKAQEEIEKSLLHIVKHGLEQTGFKKVCLAGGVALNSVANNLLAKKLELDDIFIFPAAGDAGIAAGCGYYGYHQSCEKSNQTLHRPILKSASLGRDYSDTSVAKALELYSDHVEFEKLDSTQVVDKTSEALAAGLIVGRFEGGSEFGPRSLGNRSILADPSFEGIQDIINARVKGRERYRPFAPVIPKDRANEVFEQNLASPFMLLIAKIKDQFQSQLPSITHVDGTGRFQTVTEEDNSFFYKVCNAIGDKRSGPPVILNTSYNLAGEPIVETPEDALRSFCITDMDYLAIGDFWVKKKTSAGSYEDKLNRIQEEKIPGGLGVEQPSVYETMQYLDRLLFDVNGQTPSVSDGYLESLSEKIGHLKLSSRMFPMGDSKIKLIKDNVYPRLNPKGFSHLTDLRTRRMSEGLTLNEIKIVIAASNGNAPVLNSIRKNLQLTTQEWREMLFALSKKCSPFIKLNVHSKHDELAALFKTDQAIEKTFEFHEKENFSDRKSLLEFRNVLRSCQYFENVICEKLGVEALQDIEPTRIHYYQTFLLEDTPLDQLIRLFLLQSSVLKEIVFEVIPESLCQALEKHGLLIESNGEYSSSIDIYAVDGLWLATDHRYQIKPLTHEEQPVMYIGLDSLGLVNTAPRKVGKQALDLCTGSGVQALAASRYNDHVTAVDMNPRAVRFGRFNADLNGIDNVSFKYGDLYEPAGDIIFDLILANPPFVPSPEKLYRFRDGGSKGEDILCRIVDGAAERLSSQGRLHIVTDLVDVPVYEDKLHLWWGDTASEQLVLHTADRDEILFSVPHCHKPFSQSFENYNEQLEQWVNNFRASGIHRVNFGYILIHKSPRSSYYTRAIHSPKQPIHKTVSEYFNTTKKLALSDTRLDQFVLRVEPMLRFKHEVDVGGDNEKMEFYVPDHPYFTTYQVDQEIFDGLRTIGAERPLYARFVNHDNKDWIHDLILKGILRLETPNAEQRIAVSEGASKKAKIVEEETKTTPTCVSSYLS